MDTKKRLLSSIVIIVGLFEMLKAEVCPTFTCGALPDAQCTKKTSNDTATVRSYVLQKCPKDSQQCPFYNLEQADVLTCEEKDYGKIKLYPGGPCGNSTECIYGTCTEGICIGTKNGEKCSRHAECNYGNACRKNETLSEIKFCLPQLKEGDACQEEYDCPNTHGCYNKTCIRYFSLPNGHPVEDTPHKFLSFCQSGFEYNDACASLTLPQKDTQCDNGTPCNYTNFDGTSVVLANNCLCGLNPLGAKYCKLGSGHKEFQDYVKRQQDVLKDTANCNTEERGFCNYNRKFPSILFTDVTQKLNNAKVLAEFSHELAGADQCVINVAFPEFTPVQPEPPGPTPEVQSKCAKYTCKSSEPTCVASHFAKLNVTSYQINVTVSDICKKGEFCDIGGEPNDVFYQEKDVNGTCRATPTPPITLRFPGESCEADANCFQPDKSKYPNETLVGTCKYATCQGYNATQNCSETAWCWIGNYCSADGLCVAQKKESENCTMTTQCKNNLLCLDGKCQNAWFSLSANTTVVADMFTPAANYCKFGRAYNGVCDYLNSTDVVDTKTKLVTCTVGQKCNYTSLAGPSQLDCQCGYNADGLAYCPKGNNQDTDKWTSLALKRASILNNKCHSESRAFCYSADFTVDKDYEHQTESAHLFYGAPSCVTKVLSSSFLNISVITLLLVLISLFLF